MYVLTEEFLNMIFMDKLSPVTNAFHSQSTLFFPCSTELVYSFRESLLNLPSNMTRMKWQLWVSRTTDYCLGVAPILNIIRISRKVVACLTKWVTSLSYKISKTVSSAQGVIRHSIHTVSHPKYLWVTPSACQHNIKESESLYIHTHKIHRICVLGNKILRWC